MSNIELQAPIDIFRTDYTSLQGQFHTSVADITDIIIITTCTCRFWNVQPEQQIGRFLIIEIKATRKTTVEQAKFNPYIQVGSSFPCDIRITHHTESSRHAIGRRSRQIVCVYVCKITYIIITLLTNREFQFQFVHPRSCEKTFFINQPCGTSRPEITPTVFLCET